MLITRSVTMVEYRSAVVLLFTAQIATSGSVFLTNLNSACFRCICHAANECSMSQRCSNGYCGPFSISQIYWADAGRHVLKNDDPKRKEAYMDCARDYECATEIVSKYMQKYGRDCNGDGVTNCDDYVQIHYNGGNNCETRIDDKAFRNRYNSCRRMAIA